MNQVAAFWNFIAAVAVVQRDITKQFGVDLDRLFERPPLLVDAPLSLVAVPYYADSVEKGYYYPDYEDVRLDQYGLYGWPPATVTVRMGYGPKTRQLVCSNVSVFPND